MNPEALKVLQQISAVLPADGAERLARLESAPEPTLWQGDLAAAIDHTLLKPAAMSPDIRHLCEEAMQWQFASVCVNSCWVPLCAEVLAGTPVKVCTVVGFPLGAMESGAKALETSRAITNGAHEIDMVIPVGHLKEMAWRHVYDDIRGVVVAANGTPVKVIIETALLENDEKVIACLLSVAAGAHFVKTSTGFSGGGATADDVALMRATVRSLAQVKASGGIRDRAAAIAMIKAGASRLGTSSGVAIVQGETGASAY